MPVGLEQETRDGEGETERGQERGGPVGAGGQGEGARNGGGQAEGGDDRQSVGRHRVSDLHLGVGPELDELLLGRAQRKLSTAEWASRAYGGGVAAPAAAGADDVLGEHGRELRAAALHGDREAAARLGILLLCRNPEAAYRLGLLKEAEGDFWNAGRWFDLAADAGHPAARQRVGRKNADPAP